MVLFAVLAVFAVRMVAVLIALIRSDLPMYSRVFIGWFGPRGIGTVVLGLIVLERGQIEEADAHHTGRRGRGDDQPAGAQPDGPAGHPPVRLSASGRGCAVAFRPP